MNPYQNGYDFAQAHPILFLLLLLGFIIFTYYYLRAKYREFIARHTPPPKIPVLEVPVVQTNDPPTPTLGEVLSTPEPSAKFINIPKPIPEKPPEPKRRPGFIGTDD